MKKLNLLIKSVVFLGMFSTAFADDNSQQTAMSYTEKYTGFDMNLGVGYAGLSTKLLFNNSAGTETATVKFGADGVSAQLKIGGNYGFAERWLVGLEAYGQYNNAKITHDYALNALQVSRTLTAHWNLGLDLRLGVAFAPSNLVFIYGGPDWAHYKFNYQITNGTTSVVNDTNSKFKIGGVFGAGTEQMFSDHWTMRLTFDYRWYPSETYLQSNGDTHTVKSRIATTMFMVGYKF